MMPKTILACDTTQGACSAALWHAGEVIEDRLVDMQRGHAEALLPLLADIKTTAPDIWAQVDALAVTIGPGTFTGVRVGISAMRGLALAMAVPVAGFSTLHMMALGSSTQAHRLVAVDARRDTYYTQICTADGTPCEAPTARSLAACWDLAGVYPGAPMAVIGTGAAAICTPTQSEFRADPAPAWPQASILAAHAASYALGDLARFRATPLYLRPPDATLPDPAKRLLFDDEHNT
ncbi:MAG: tRNA (adenosine(37)-N6)-threonylcarbamoyltransferase complex dimerization subunit type 1 TsaB [Rhizobiales bacterium TMED143]|nr:tRNA (adenosine(37)-N6)-threonylcarbamoyltransferase complex dimerization subunit type 1 TsaB [Rhodobiaceae bacterium]MBL6786725.1 tRNA (adenosine(37)-N6)-threonylcarbamoyltransferase complex dimerization subunit type 1 TsaB [PS1 clade bacterium]OUV92710.1 MAG: tRNA (adenosine(37)-N6)-threonylcarbamoyltransferase complex dimerization subunit type 1 TsaB [Rhizobiales bacterium TMED143]CAI8411310.1 MAG: tRNA threonylcarbamoyladenosine biosynthesis protein TsaB [Rhodobiaceae bacterium UBA7378]|tara:strand:+ start:90 stop:794 length:705 start_codon:yes stop_codon:yes gene_type:complete